MLDVLIDVVHHISVVLSLVSKSHVVFLSFDVWLASLLVESNQFLPWKKIDFLRFRILTSCSGRIDDLIKCLVIDVLSIIVVRWEVCTQDLAKIPSKRHVVVIKYIFMRVIEMELFVELVLIESIHWCQGVVSKPDSQVSVRVNRGVLIEALVCT